MRIGEMKSGQEGTTSAARTRRDGASLACLPVSLVLSLGLAMAGCQSQPTAEETYLALVAGNAESAFSSAELLARPDLETVTPDGGVYGDPAMRYDAVKVATLLAPLGLDPGVLVEFMAWDGFAAVLSADLLLNTDETRAIGYLAIEDPSEPWPELADGTGSAGPYYLIWRNAEASGIVPEQWPYRVTRIHAQASIEVRYPGIVPRAPSMDEERVREGFDAFVRHCLPCHTMNREGPSSLGPDLNTPRSAVTYLPRDILVELIRDPQRVRYFASGRMPAFSKRVLPDQELDGILTYLEHMASRADGVQ